MSVAPAYADPDLDQVGSYTSRAYASIPHPVIPGAINTSAHLWLMRGEIVSPAVPKQILVTPSDDSYSFCRYCLARTKGRAVICDAANRVVRVEVTCNPCYIRRRGGMEPAGVTAWVSERFREESHSKSAEVSSYAKVRLNQITHYVSVMATWWDERLAEARDQAPKWMLKSLATAPSGWIDRPAAARLDAARQAAMSEAVDLGEPASLVGVDELLAQVTALMNDE
jgi:hypothetical protein